jgi:hypothetical protein
MDKAAGGRELDSVDQEFHAEMANRSFDQFSESGQCLSRAALTQDRAKLEQATERVVRFVDQHVAHLSASPTGEPPSYDEFHNALELLGTMLQKYRLLIDQVSLASTTPQIQVDWKGPFRSTLA